MIGKTISHYRILEKLGEGGMGVVYKAEDTKLKRTVALKFLPAESTRDPEAKARFVREAQAASALEHPNICNIHEIDETDDGRLFICMACYEGESLRGRITRRPLKLEEAIDVASQVALGLAKAHEKGIVHRDIKPANILTTEDGRVQIVDFGLAKLALEPKLTRVGSTTGTIAYMSPEQARGEDVDARTDIWSLGVVLYEMITGQRPFRADRDQAVIHSIVNEEPEPMTALRTGVPVELERIVRKAIAKRADERYQHADDLIADLRSLRRELDSSQVTVAAPAASPGAARARVVPVWGWIVVAAVIVVALAVVWTATRRGATRSSLDGRKVVVALLENRTGDSALDPIGQMVTDSITEGLLQIGVVEVVPSAVAVESGAGRRGDLSSLASATGAGLIVSGAYYLEGDDLRFQVNLTDARVEKVVVVIPAVKGPRARPAPAVEQLRQRAMGAVAFHIEPGMIRGEVASPPTYDAYREYAVGLGLFGTEPLSALEHFERAAAMDTTFVAPWMIIYYCYANSGKHAAADSLVRALSERRERLSTYEGWFLDYLDASLRGNNTEELRVLRLMHEASPDDYVVAYLLGITALSLNRPGEAVEALLSARREDEDTALYHQSWGYGVMSRALHLLGYYEQELEVLQLARELYPDAMYLRGHEARALVALGRMDDLEALIDESLSLPAGSGTPAGVMERASIALRVHVGREESIAMAERAIAWRKQSLEGTTVADDWSGHLYLASELQLAERWQEARELYLQLDSERPDDEDVQGTLGVIAARLGEQEKAREIMDELRRLDRPYLRGSNSYWAASIAAQLGERDLAVELIRQALSEGVGVSTLLHTDMDFEPLHGYPPFEELRRPKG
jgi:tetratricopeptide (TPR) repeat protein